MSTTDFIQFDATRKVEVPNPRYPRPQPGKTTLNLYFGTNGVASPERQAFMMSFDQKIESSAHFHHVDQFHVFIGCSDCYYRRQDIGSLDVLYTDADTVYGPFGSRNGELHAIVFRPHGSNFIGHLPVDKEQLVRTGPKRVYYKSLSEWVDQLPPKANESEVFEFMPMETDGAGGCAIAAGKGATFGSPMPNRFGGQYFLVISGQVEHEGKILSKLALGHCQAGSESAAFHVVGDSAQMVMLQLMQPTDDRAAVS